MNVILAGALRRVLILLLALVSCPGYATILTVSNLDDNRPGSLRDTIRPPVRAIQFDLP